MSRDILSRTKKWSTGYAWPLTFYKCLCWYCEQPSCHRKQFLTFTPGLAPFDHPFHQCQPQPQGVLWHLFQTNRLKLHEFQMPHFCVHLLSLRVWVNFTVKALVWQMKIEQLISTIPIAAQIFLLQYLPVIQTTPCLFPPTQTGVQDFGFLPRRVSRRMGTRMVRSWVRERIYIKSHFPWKVQSLTSVNEENISSLKIFLQKVLFRQVRMQHILSHIQKTYGFLENNLFFFPSCELAC